MHGARWRGVLEVLGRTDALDDEELERAMADALDRARTAHVLVSPPDELAYHVALCIADADDVLAALRSLHAADLALAFECAQGRAPAVAEFRRRFLGDLNHVVDKYPVLASERADVVQALFERLLVAPGDGEPRIANYRGSGPLQGWVRVAALRFAMNRARGSAAERRLFQAEGPDSGDGGGWQPTIRSVEDRFVQRAYGDAVRESVEAAFSRLTARERNLLRHHVIQGLTIDQIAPVYGVHRSTVARWLDRARSRLAAAARDVLIERHGLAAGDVQSVMRCVNSQVEVSVGRLLGD